MGERAARIVAERFDVETNTARIAAMLTEVAARCPRRR
jgi:hypothetical protein